MSFFIGTGRYYNILPDNMTPWQYTLHEVYNDHYSGKDDDYKLSIAERKNLWKKAQKAYNKLKRTNPEAIKELSDSREKYTINKDVMAGIRRRKRRRMGYYSDEDEEDMKRKRKKRVKKATKRNEKRKKHKTYKAKKKRLTKEIFGSESE